MRLTILVFALCLLRPVPDLRADTGITLAREGHFLVLRAPHVPGGEIRVNYIEAYCRAGSTDADWVKHTKIPHTNRLVSASADGKSMVLEDTLADGVVVTHQVRVVQDGVKFQVTATNGTSRASEALWAQPCVRLGAFTGYEPSGGPDIDDYLPKCFVYRNGVATRMPFSPWAKQARYTPGQVWGAPGVNPADLNPRPHSTLVPSNGLIGAYSADEAWVFATAWHPYQELFQGVARCLHSDFRIGGLQPGEGKSIRGAIYLMPNQPDFMLARYRRDFPEHIPKPAPRPATP